ncbi:MAG: cell envelope biogenesis protein OmpA [Betaproteobacteria bacterium HGW-Betaproteobacteria-12]|nr:MAG: cell envelope biogenesis protein OmpA [Betaproteobacteria bacterium HGW-Betaproteobacteria-12]
MKLRTLAISSMLLLALAGARAAEQNQPEVGKVEAGKVTIAGTVPDESARAAVLGKLRELYGAANVIDRLEVGGVVPPPNWTENMTKLLGPNLKQVRKGQLNINGTQVAIRGNVPNEALRQQVVSDMATALNPTYSIDNALVVAAGGGQSLLDDTLSNRVVEFESGSATLTLHGRAILDEMLVAIKQIGTPRLQVIGHTDSSGNRLANIGLSLARAGTVRNYLIERGVPSETLNALGSGPDHPVAANETAEGRAKNRRIEFRLVN